MNTTAPLSVSAIDGRGDRTAGSSSLRRISTVADLAAILACMDPQTPVVLDPVLRGAEGLSPEQHPRAVVADVDATAYLNPWDGDQPPVPALELGARLVPEPAAPIPPEAYACDSLQRMAEAFDAGDLGDGLRAVADALSDAAHQVMTEAVPWLRPSSPLVEQFADVASLLRGIASDMRSTFAPTAEAELRRADLE